MPRQIALTRPLCIFDLETTGTDIMRDRIVEIAVVVMHPGGGQTVRDWRINPQMPIPEAASAVHGIKDEDVKSCPTFAELAPTLISVFAGADVGGYNARSFDVPLLDAEFERAGISPSPLSESLCVDAKEIFHAREPRDLTAAVRFYCDETLQGAHGARADVVATARVLVAQLSRYPDLPLSVGELAALYARKERFVDPTRKLRFDDNGQVVVNFGQHRGTLLAELAIKKRDYLEWMLQGEWHPKVKDVIKVTLETV